MTKELTQETAAAEALKIFYDHLISLGQGFQLDPENDSECFADEIIITRDDMSRPNPNWAEVGYVESDQVGDHTVHTFENVQTFKGHSRITMKTVKVGEFYACLPC